MGLLLADWSVELFRARRRRAKKAKLEKGVEPAGGGVAESSAKSF